MGIRQVEKLYKKIVTGDPKAHVCHINAGVREEIFRKIMDDLGRLMPKMNRCVPGSVEYYGLDGEIRSLLLKEVQVIIDDYVVSMRNGTLVRWKKMYGDIDQYIADFYRYRSCAGSPGSARATWQYGFYENDTA